MTQVDMKIEAKSDQLNSDDLIGGPRTITITAVRGVDGDQPVAVSFEGDDGKPFKPCKTVRRVMVHCWGDDAKVYPGRRMTLYRDPNVAFGGMKVGGIRVSHMSHIDRPMVIPLMVTRGKKAAYEVKPLQAEVRQAPSRTNRGANQDERDAFGQDEPDGRVPVEEWAGAFSRSLHSYDDVDEMREAWNTRKQELHDKNPALFKELNRAIAERAAEIATA